VLGLGRALRRAGVDARILAPCDGPPPDVAVTPLGNSVPTASNGSVAAIAPDPSAAMRTIRALRDEAFDVVNIHEPLAPGPPLTAVLFSAAPTVGTFHRSGESAWLRSLKPLARWVTSHLNVRAAVSEEARATAQATLGGTYEMVWNGIDPADYRFADPWPTDGPTVMFIGRHEPRKGLAVLIRAMERLEPDVRLWVASHGPETESLRAATADEGRIEWLGVISEAEKVRRISGCDVLCAPSLHGESFGVVLLEGLAARTPVVASDLSGYRMVARPGKEALLVAPGDDAALASAVQSALAGGPEIEAMVERGAARAEAFSLDSLASRYVELFDKALGAGTAGER
jgi:phosphatidylinositol alpha-mannosyltransferase